jgi:hypothetical protein
VVASVVQVVILGFRLLVDPPWVRAVQEWESILAREFEISLLLYTHSFGI